MNECVASEDCIHEKLTHYCFDIAIERAGDSPKGFFCVLTSLLHSCRIHKTLGQGGGQRAEHANSTSKSRSILNPVDPQVIDQRALRRDVLIHHINIFFGRRRPMYQATVRPRTKPLI